MQFGSSKTDLLLQQAFEDWLINYNAQKTRIAYREAWREFMAWLGKPLSQATYSDALAYRVYLEQTPRPKTHQPYSASSINQQLAALSSFCVYAFTRQLIPLNPFHGVKRKPIHPYGKARWLDGETKQDVQLLQHIDTDTEQGRRDLALFLLFLTTGLRVGVVANLRVGNLRKQGNQLMLRYTEKGGGEVEKTLEPVTATALQTYLSYRRNLTANAPLFVATARGRRAAANLRHTSIAARRGDTPLTFGAINKLLKSYCDRAFGKGHGITPHSLRHTAARNAALAGATLNEISQLLAHKSPAVTLVYLHATDRLGDVVSRKLGSRYGALSEDDEATV